MDEPRYIDDGDEFVEEDSGWKHPESLTNSDLIQECMNVYRVSKSVCKKNGCLTTMYGYECLVGKRDENRRSVSNEKHG